MPLPSPRRLTLLLPLLLAACASVERAATPPAPTPELPARWAATDTDRPLADPALAVWWQQLGSSEFNTLVERALARNTNLRSAQAALRQARALRAASEAATRPTLSLGSQAKRQQTDGAGGSSSLSLGFSTSWETDLWGAQSLGLAASRADERAAEADLAATRLALLAELGLAWTQWQADLARQQITQASLRSLEQTASLVRWNAQAGLASALDVEQTVQTLESTRASLLALNTQVSQDQHAIAVLAGDAPATPLPDISGSLMDLGWPQLDQALGQWAAGQPADLLRRRPDLLSAEAGVQAAWLRRRQADRATWPGLSLTGTLGLQAATLAGLGQPGAALATLGAAVDWTLLDGGRQDAQREQQDAALDAARASYDAALLNALKDTEDSLVALRGATERQAALRLSAQAAQQALRLSQARQQAGLISTASLLEAQRTALSSDLSWIAARADQASNLIRTWKSLGGGWDVPAAR